MIGKTLIEGITLDPSVKVIACGRSVDSLKEVFKTNKNVSCFDINKSIEDFIKLKFDSVIHLSCPTESSYFVNNPVETIDSIYSLTKKMLEICRIKKVPMVYASSMEAYGQVLTKKPSKEDELGYIPLNNVRSSYSEGKRIAELLCYSYSKEYDVDVKIARLAQTFGAGTDYMHDPRVFAYIARCITENKNIELATDGKSMGNYCYLADVIRALLIVLKNGNNGETYNVSNLKCHFSIKNLAKKPIKFFSSKIKVKTNCSKSKMYPNKTSLKMDANKLTKLGFTAKYNLEEMFKNSGVNKRDIDSICIALGPGSYTGVRIAMTIAKVYCSVANIKLYGISTLRLYAGNRENTMVIMDARANRAYLSIYDKDRIIVGDCAKELKDIDCASYNVVLDGSLVGRENTFVDIPSCFLNTRAFWSGIDDIDHLTPLYLKESDAYYR